MQIIYPTQGTCSKAIEIDINPETDIINSVRFAGGCPGNTVGVAALAKGRKAQDVISILEGIPCGNKSTSCPDQLAKALKQILSSK